MQEPLDHQCNKSLEGILPIHQCSLHQRSYPNIPKECIADYTGCNINFLSKGTYRVCNNIKQIINRTKNKRKHENNSILIEDYVMESNQRVKYK